MNLYKVTNWIAEGLKSDSQKINEVIENISEKSADFKKQSHQFYKEKIEDERERYEIMNLISIMYFYTEINPLPFPILKKFTKYSFTELRMEDKYLCFFNSISEELDFRSDRYKLYAKKSLILPNVDRITFKIISVNKNAKVTKKEVLTDLVDFFNKITDSISFFTEIKNLIENINVDIAYTNNFVEKYRNQKEMLYLLSVSLPKNSQELMLESMSKNNIEISIDLFINNLIKLEKNVVKLEEKANEFFYISDAIKNMKMDIIKNNSNCNLLHSYILKEKLQKKLTNNNSASFKRLKL